MKKLVFKKNKSSMFIFGFRIFMIINFNLLFLIITFFSIIFVALARLRPGKPWICMKRAWRTDNYNIIFCIFIYLTSYKSRSTFHARPGPGYEISTQYTKTIILRESYRIFKSVAWTISKQLQHIFYDCKWFKEFQIYKFYNFKDFNVFEWCTCTHDNVFCDAFYYNCWVMFEAI